MRTSESIRVGALAPIELVLFVLVVGEELGWRGYALPKLLEKRSALTASLILGVLTAFVLLTIEYSILMTWVFVHTSAAFISPPCSMAPSTVLRASS